jgi:hypothetical protein
VDQPGIIVLARFPDLSFHAEPRADATDTSPPSSVGRIIDQALAFKLLSGVTLLLLAAAVFPLFSNRADKPAASPSAAEASPPWQTGPTAGPAEPAVAQSPATRPAIMVPAMPQPSAAPVILPPPPDATVALPPVARADSSPWPGPSRAAGPQDGLAGETPRAEANRSMAVGRQPEYQADTRAGSRRDAPRPSAEPYPDHPVPGNHYDSTRPSAD